MFKYSADNELVSLKLIDFQTARFGQPGIDLGTLLSGNVKSDMYHENFEKYMHLYHQSLIDTIKSNPSIDLTRFSYERFVKDYAQHAWIGFMTILFFLPALDDNMSKAEAFMTLELTPEAIGEFLEGFGSPETLKHTGLFLKHLIDLNEKYVKDE